MSITSNVEKQLAPGYSTSIVLAIGAAATRTAVALSEGLAAEATDDSHFCAGGAMRDIRTGNDVGLFLSVIQEGSSEGYISISRWK